MLTKDNSKKQQGSEDKSDDSSQVAVDERHGSFVSNNIVQLITITVAPVLMIAMFNRLWYAVPLIIVISIVYAATRHELMRPILEHAVRFCSSIVTFMFVVFCALWFVSLFL